MSAPLRPYSETYVSGLRVQQIGRELRAPIHILRRLGRSGRQIVTHRALGGGVWYSTRYRSAALASAAVVDVRRMYPRWRTGAAICALSRGGRAVGS